MSVASPALCIVSKQVVVEGASDDRRPSRVRGLDGDLDEGGAEVVVGVIVGGGRVDLDGVGVDVDGVPEDDSVRVADTLLDLLDGVTVVPGRDADFLLTAHLLALGRALALDVRL